MSTLYKLLMVMLLVFAPAFTEEEKEEPSNGDECLELVKFKFDDRDWEKGFSDDSEEGAITEFVLKGQNVDDWSELVAVQKLPPIDGSVEDFYKLFIENLKKVVGDGNVESKVLNQTDDSIYFEWWVPKGEYAQHEWLKLFKTPRSTMLVRYTTKDLDNVEKVRGFWEKNLADATYSTAWDCAIKQ